MILEYSQQNIAKLSLAAIKARQQALDTTLELPGFIDVLLSNALKNDPAFQGSNTYYKQPYPREVRIAPPVREMYDAIQAIRWRIDEINATVSDSKKNLALRKELYAKTIEPVRVFTIKERPTYWWGDTLKAINLRVGYVNNDPSKCYPAMLGKQQSHANAGGNTGAGKSVMMDAMLLSYLTEYPPWELNLFLIDGKMLEHAKYLQANKCPQIRNVGITGSGSYALSVYKFFDTEMKQLYDLGSIIGSNSLTGIRDLLNLNIPSCILIHDEYSQSIENTTPKEREQFDYHQQSIAKLGRAVHYHMLPTSQTFAGVMKSDTQGQFQLGLSVAANDDNSENLIGNTGATALKSMIGYCLINPSRKENKPELNVLYKVAYLNVESDEGSIQFQSMLENICKVAEQYGATQQPTSFNEKQQPNIRLFNKDYDFIKPQAISVAKSQKRSLLAPILLGDATLYDGSKTQKKGFIPLCYDRKENICIHSTDVATLQYLCRLVARSLESSEKTRTAKHNAIIDNAVLFDDKLTNSIRKDFTSSFDYKAIASAVANLESYLRYSQLCEGNNIELTPEGYLNYYAKKYPEKPMAKFFKQFPQNTLDSWVNTLGGTLLDYLDNRAVNKQAADFPELNQEQFWLAQNTQVLSNLISMFNFYNKRKGLQQDEYCRSTDFQPFFYWMFAPQLNEGMTKRGVINDDFFDLINRGPTVGVFFIIVVNELKGHVKLVDSCRHVILNNPDSSLVASRDICNFNDTTGINCRYIKMDGTSDDSFYFKKYFLGVNVDPMNF